MRKLEPDKGSDKTSPSRPDELEDWLNRRLYHPLAMALARRLQHTGISPNAVSIAGGVMVVVASVIYGGFQSPIWMVLGLLALMSWHVLDGADGDLARLTGRESAFGEMVDGACDYLSHLVLYLVLASVLAEQIGAIGWPLMIAAGCARAVQQNFYETQRKQYGWWVYERPWLRAGPAQANGKDGPISALAGFYMRVSERMAAQGHEIDMALAQCPQEDRDALRQTIKDALAPYVQSLWPLSSNYRTLVIGLAMIVSQPLMIVAFELVVLTFIMILALLRANRLIASIKAQIEGSSER